MDRLHEWDICLSNWLAKKLIRLKVTYLSVRPLVCGWYGDVTLWLVPARVRIFSISALQNSRPHRIWNWTKIYKNITSWFVLCAGDMANFCQLENG